MEGLRLGMGGSWGGKSFSWGSGLQLLSRGLPLCGTNGRGWRETIALGYSGVWVPSVGVGGHPRDPGGTCLLLMRLRGCVEYLNLDVGGSRSLEVPGEGPSAAGPARSWWVLISSLKVFGL